MKNLEKHPPPLPYHIFPKTSTCLARSADNSPTWQTYSLNPTPLSTPFPIFNSYKFHSYKNQFHSFQGNTPTETIPKSNITIKTFIFIHSSLETPFPLANLKNILTHFLYSIFLALFSSEKPETRELKSTHQSLQHLYQQNHR